MSQWEKLIEAILNERTDLRFEDLKKALIEIGFVCKQPRSGSSHYTFRKPGMRPITIPKSKTIGKPYVRMVAAAVKAMQEDSQNEQ